MQDGGQYRTRDMHYAAYLRVASVPFLDTKVEVGKDGKRHVYFLFEPQDTTVMRDLKKQYFSGRAKVSALEYAQALKTMKILTHMDEDGTDAEDRR